MNLTHLQANAIETNDPSSCETCRRMIAKWNLIHWENYPMGVWHETPSGDYHTYIVRRYAAS
jgi:hypothetical protein